MSQNKFFAALIGTVFSLGLAAGEAPTFTYTPIDHPNAKSTSGSGIECAWGDCRLFYRPSERNPRISAQGR